MTFYVRYTLGFILCDLKIMYSFQIALYTSLASSHMTRQLVTLYVRGRKRETHQRHVVGVANFLDTIHIVSTMYAIELTYTLNSLGEDSTP